MSGRRAGGPRYGRSPWDRPRTPTWVYGLVGVLLTLVVVLGIVIVMLLGSDNTGLASATSTPTVAATQTGATPTPGPTAGATAAPTAEPTPAPTPKATVETTLPPATTPPGGSPAPSTKPTLVTFSLPHKADCNADNGTGQVGQISINWSTTGATGVRISIDPPTAAGAYAYGYADYGPQGPALVPFACAAPLHDSGGDYHLYVITTLHTTGYYQYRYQKVYQSPGPTATP